MIEDELKQLCKRMRLAYVYDYVTQENRTEVLYKELLNCLKYEQREREHSKADRLIRKAGFKSTKPISQYEWHDQIEIPSSTNHEELVT